MALNAARVQETLFQVVLGAGAEAVERAVIDRQTTGEKDIGKVASNMALLFKSTKGDVYWVLGITSSRVSRRSEMDVEVLDRAGAALKLYARLTAMIGEEGASRWLKQPNPNLDGKRPIELLGSSLGRQRLASLIAALEDGSYL